MDEFEKLRSQVAQLRQGNEVIVKINQYWLYRCGVAENECRKMKNMLKKLTKKVQDLTSKKMK